MIEHLRASYPTAKGHSRWFAAALSWLVLLSSGMMGWTQEKSAPSPVPTESTPSESNAAPPDESDGSPVKVPSVLSPGARPDSILKDATEQVLVPRSQAEEFELFLREQSTTTNAVMPNDALEQMDVFVSIDKNIAKCRIEAQAKLLGANRKWLNIPIGMGLVQAIPTVQPGDTAATFPPLRIANDLPGYLWKVAPGAEPKRRLVFDALSNVATTSQGQSIRLDLPLVPATIRLELPNGEWDLNIQGTGSEVVEPFREVGLMSVATARTSGGSVTLNWSKKMAADQIQAIEVESQTTYTPSTESGLFRAVTSLAIRGPKPLGGRRFLITLPPNSQWREPLASPVPFPGYRIGKQSPAPDSDDVILLLEFEEAISRPDMEVPLEWQFGLPKDSSAVAFGIPKVEGVQRHSGSLNLIVPRNVRFQWTPQPTIQFTKQSQATDGSDSVLYRFWMNDQAEPVQAQWSVGDKVFNLKANYDAVVDTEITRLNGTIDILGDIRSLPFLQLEVRGWTLDRVLIQPSGRELDLAAIRKAITTSPDGTSSETVSIPLSLGELLGVEQAPANAVASASGASEAMPMPSDNATANSTLLKSREEMIGVVPRGIVFSCSKNNAPGGKTEAQPSSTKQDIHFALPALSWIDAESQSRFSLCVGGELTVRSVAAVLAPAVALPLQELPPAVEPAASKTTAITNRESSSRWRSALRYRVPDTRGGLEWRGTAELAGAILRARAESAIVLDRNSIHLSQVWTLDSIGSLPKSLRIAVPIEWASKTVRDGDAIAIAVDDIPVVAQWIDADIAEDDSQAALPSSGLMSGKTALLRIVLPNELDNRSTVFTHKLAIRKHWNQGGEHVGKQAFDWLLPVLEADQSIDQIYIDQFVGHVRSGEGVFCVLNSPEEAPPTSIESDNTEPRRVSFDRTLQTPRITGELSYQSADATTAIELTDVVWMQTIFKNAIEQRVRFVAKFKTEASSISLRFPSQGISDSKILINGRRAFAVPNPNDAQRVDIALGGNSAMSDNSYVMEVFSWPTGKSDWLTALNAECPEILHCQSRSAMVWQILVPTTEHLIGKSSSLTPGYRWQWQDLWMTRKSDLSQEQIEKQLGATSQPMISQQTNQYVLTSLDHRSKMTVWMAPRYLIWCPIAICVLISTYAVSEFRWIRRPWIAVVLLLSGLAFSQWAWDLSITVAQSLVAAMGVAVVYSLLKWVVDRRSRRRSVFSSRPSTAVSAASHRGGTNAGSAPSVPSPITTSMPPSNNNPAIADSTSGPPSEKLVEDAP